MVKTTHRCRWEDEGFGAHDSGEEGCSNDSHLCSSKSFISKYNNQEAAEVQGEQLKGKSASRSDLVERLFCPSNAIGSYGDVPLLAEDTKMRVRRE